MQHSQPQSLPAVPWLLMPVVQLFVWACESLGDGVGLSARIRRSALELGSALLLVGVITLGAALGLPPLLTLSGGLGLAFLCVVARSYIVVRYRYTA